jgi:hypothetical protein
VIPAVLAYPVFAVPHLMFHAGHLHGATTAQAVALTSANTGVVLLGVAVIALTVPRRRRRLSGSSSNRETRR